MTNDDEIVARISNAGFVNLETTERSVKTNKVISFDQFLQILKSNDESFELPLMPYGLRKIKKSGRTTVVAIEYPEAIIEKFVFNRETYQNVPVPRSLWFFLLRNNENDDSYTVLKTVIYSLEMPLMNEAQKLQEWPFPNHKVDFSTGVCWGNDESFAVLKNNCKLANIKSLYSIYFSAKFNDDLGFKYEPHGIGNNDRFLRHLSEEGAFATKYLRKTSKTMAGVINQLLPGN